MEIISTVNVGLQGLAAIRKGLRVYLDYKIVTRTVAPDSEPKGSVKVISGGGAGHEPGHSGFVGRGFLTTAISGDIFTSPPVNAIVKGIQVTGPKETPILLVVTNYTGDRLNFALAEKIARSRYGYENIKTILVADDIALDNVPEQVGNRGLAGTVLIHKIAGAMGESLRSLDEIYSLCQLVNENLNTIGFTFQADWTRNTIRNIEIGKGVHGEPGAFQMAEQPNFGSIVEFLIERFHKRIPKKSPVLILLNNLGGTSQHLFNAFSMVILRELNISFEIVKIISGTLFTSLDNQGISVTVLNLTHRQEEILQYIEYESEVYWDHFKRSSAPTSFTNLSNKSEPEAGSLVEATGIKTNGVLFHKVILEICNQIMQNESNLNKMDQEFGDGDTGSTLTRGGQAILNFATMKTPEYFSYPYQVFQDISLILSNDMGGTSGALLGIFFESAAQGFKSCDFESPLWLTLGNSALSAAGHSIRGDRTMLDVLLTAQDVLMTKNIDLLQELKEKCKLSAAATKTMVPKCGRAVYTNSQEVKTSQYPDPGAAFVSLVVAAIVDTIEDE